MSLLMIMMENRGDKMKVLLEDDGISLLENDMEYYLQYDAGAHMIKKKRIQITKEEAELCLLDTEEMYDIILQYQNNGIYGNSVDQDTK